MNQALEKDRAQFGKYVLVERLGRGGMAEVWKARMSGPAGFQRTLVLKRILPHLVEDEHFKQMFVAEARLCGRLNHANIVQVFELGDVDGELYLAMEYVRGHDLTNVVRAQLLHGAPLWPGLGAFVVREVCRALAYAHALTDERGQPLRLIHRDVSPSNVMIGFDGAVKLLDFGIAKVLAEAGENHTVTGTLKGKFGYMAPEQVEGKQFDHRADLFAAGIVLYEVLTGRRLFKGHGDLSTISLVREARVEPPSLLNPAVPPELDAICLKALARQPDERWRGCDEMAVALDDVVHQLKWGPERLAQMLRDLYPDEPSTSAVVPLGGGGESVSQSYRTLDALRRHQVRLRVAWGVAGLAALGLVAWLIAARAVSGPEESPRAAVAASDPASAVAAAAPVSPPPAAAPVHPAVAAAPALSSTVTVRVVSSPAGADVYVAEERTSRGRTPVALTLPRGTGSARVTVRLRGYAAQEAEVTPDSDSRLQMTLVKPARSRQAPSRHKAAKKPDLRRGDVVDPFAR